MTEEEYQMLLDNIQRTGFNEPILVARHKDADNPDIRYRIIAGEHRWRAAIELGFEKIPAIVRTFDIPTQKKQIVRMNKIRGMPDIDKLNRLVEDMIQANEVTLDEAAFELGFADENEFDLVRESMREMVPEEGRKEFDKKSKKAETADDLYALVMTLMKKYGETTVAHWMIVAVGRGRNLWIQLDGALVRSFEKMGRECIEHAVTFDSVILAALKEANKDFDKFVKKHKDELNELDEETEEVEDFYEDNSEEYDE